MGWSLGQFNLVWPGAGHQLFHIGDGFGVARVFGQVLPFVRVGHVIVEF